MSHSPNGRYVDKGKYNGIGGKGNIGTYSHSRATAAGLVELGSRKVYTLEMSGGGRGGDGGWGRAT